MGEDRLVTTPDGRKVLFVVVDGRQFAGVASAARHVMLECGVTPHEATAFVWELPRAKE